VRSVRNMATLAALLPVAFAASGCQTTQQQNDRLELRATRELASRKPVAVDKPSPDVKVTGTSVVSGKDGSAIVVALQNNGTKAASDLPIEVGAGGRVLNGGKELPYFQTHAPALAPGERGTWVFTTKEKAGGDPFAKVGAAPSPPVSSADGLPELAATASAQQGGSVTVDVANKSDIPQYDLQVYAVAKDAHGYLAAGAATLEHLGSGSDHSVALHLTGDPKNAPVQLFTSPTYFE
jgi:hypothetical protein